MSLINDSSNSGTPTDGTLPADTVDTPPPAAIQHFTLAPFTQEASSTFTPLTIDTRESAAPLRPSSLSVKKSPSASFSGGPLRRTGSNLSVSHSHAEPEQRTIFDCAFFMEQFQHVYKERSKRIYGAALRTANDAITSLIDEKFYDDRERFRVRSGRVKSWRSLYEKAHGEYLDAMARVREEEERGEAGGRSSLPIINKAVDVFDSFVHDIVGTRVVCDTQKDVERLADVISNIAFVAETYDKAMKGRGASASGGSRTGGGGGASFEGTSLGGATATSTADMAPRESGFFIAEKFANDTSRFVKRCDEPSGYRGVHLRVEIPTHVNGRIRAVPVEIQIRTLLQDACSELAHSQVYKGRGEIDNELLRLSEEIFKAAHKMDDVAQSLADRLKVNYELDPRERGREKQVKHMVELINSPLPFRGGGGGRGRDPSQHHPEASDDGHPEDDDFSMHNPGPTASPLPIPSHTKHGIKVGAHFYGICVHVSRYYALVNLQDMEAGAEGSRRWTSRPAICFLDTFERHDALGFLNDHFVENFKYGCTVHHLHEADEKNKARVEVLLALE